MGLQDINSGKKQLANGKIYSLVSSALLPSIAVSITNVALPDIAESFDIAIATVNWAVIAFFISLTSLVVSLGALGDHYGKKTLLQLGNCIFTIASVACALASELWILIFARFVQGIGAAFIMSQTLAIAAAAIEEKRIGSVMGLLGSMSALGTALGPAIGGLAIAVAGWESIFWLMLPLTLTNYFLCNRYIPHEEPKQTNKGRFDLLGASLLTLSCLLYVLSMMLGNALSSAQSIGYLVASLIVFFAFLLSQKRIKIPLINPAMFNNSARNTALFTHLIVDAVAMSFLVIGPFYLVYAQNVSLLEAGLVMSVGPCIAFFSGYPAGKLVDSIGVNNVMLLGLGLMTVGVFAFSILTVVWGVYGYLLALLIITPGRQLFHASNYTYVMNSVSAREKGAASGILNLCKNIGFMTGASLFVSIFSSKLEGVTISVATKSNIDKAFSETYLLSSVFLGLAFIFILLFRDQIEQTKHES